MVEDDECGDEKDGGVYYGVGGEGPLLGGGCGGDGQAIFERECVGNAVEVAFRRSVVKWFVVNGR